MKFFNLLKTSFFLNLKKISILSPDFQKYFQHTQHLVNVFPIFLRYYNSSAIYTCLITNPKIMIFNLTRNTIVYVSFLLKSSKLDFL